jgi:simple sugar transport system permease protein
VSTTAPPIPPPSLPEPPPEEPPRGWKGWTLPHVGGVLTSVATTILAFLIAGLVVLFTGHNPLAVYKGIFQGAGLDWFLPWVTGDARADAAFNLQQTLLQTTTLILTGLAVAFAFRCGMFNIGGQGQWTMGAIVSVWVGSSWAGLAGPAHILIVIVLAALAGAAFAGIAGFLKATVGAHEVVTTIMLNWIAYWVGSYLFGLGGPLQNDNPIQASVPISNDVVEAARLPVIWGDPVLQGLTIGIFIAFGALVVYWLTLSRTTLGFRVRAVGRSAEAARYGGISVRQSYFLAMAISGGFAGLGGALDILGWQFRLGTLDVQSATVGFTGIAVAFLGRNTAVGVLFAAFLFGALQYGTSSRSLDPDIFDPSLAGNLQLMIQALVLLFIGADVLILWLWRRGRLGWLHTPTMPSLPSFRRRRHGGEARGFAASDLDVPPLPRVPMGERVRGWALTRVPRGPAAIAAASIVLALVAFWLAVPPVTARSMAVPLAVAIVAFALGAWAAWRGARRAGLTAMALALIFGALGIAATQSSVGNLEAVFVWGTLVAAMLRYATPLILAAIGGMFSERSGVVNIGLEGMLLVGAFFGFLGADKLGSWVWGVVLAILAGAVLALIHAVVSIHLRADQILSGTGVWLLGWGLTGYLFIDIYGPEGTPGEVSAIPDVHLAFLDDVPFIGQAIGDLNLLIWFALLMVPLSYWIMFRTAFGLRLRSVGEHPRAAETVGLSVYRLRYTGVTISGILAALGGAFLSIGFVDSFSENMSRGQGFIALAALIFGNWRPKGIFFAAILFGSASAIAQRLPVYSESLAVLFQTLPYLLTLIAVAGVIRRPRPPAAVGIPYIRS